MFPDIPYARRLLVVGLDDNTPGDPVKEPEFLPWHSEPSNQAIERKEKGFPEALNKCGGEPDGFS